MCTNDQTETGTTKKDFAGRISTQTLVQLDLEDGSTIVAPETVLFKERALSDIGTIIDIICRLTGKCGDRGGGDGDGGRGGRVCYKTVIASDGSITIVPVRCPTATAMA